MAAAICIYISGTSGVYAQFEGLDRKLRNAPIEKRVPSELRPEGLSYKGFIFEPKISVSEKYTSNVLATEENEKSDYITVVAPGVKISKEYDGHSFFISGGANIERFARRSEENKEEYNIAAGANIVLNSRWSFPFFVRKFMVKRARDALRDSELSKEPLGIQVLKAQTGIVRKFNRVSLELIGGYESRRFDNGGSSDGNSAVIFSGGDRQIYKTGLTANYDFPRDVKGKFPEHRLFGEIEYERQLYDRRSFVAGSFSGDDGSRHKIGLLAGFETRYKGLLFARIGGGFFHENFDQQDIESTTSTDFTADIAYSPFSKMTMRFEAERNINQDNGFTQGIKESRFLLGADYEILHNLYWENDITYSIFEVTDEDREDKDYGAEMRLRYLNSRNLTSNLAIGYLQRESDQSEESFKDLNFRIFFTTAF